MKILVTGGNGFLGRKLIGRLLKMGYKVRGMSRHPLVLDDGSYEFLKGDIRKREDVRAALEGCDTVFHVAAKVGVWGRREEFYETNVMGTRNLVEVAQEMGVKYFIYTSSPSVVFSGRNLRGVDEKISYGTRFLCDYAETKAEAEKYVLSQNKVKGIKTIALRPHLIWGEGDTHLIPKVVEMALEKRLKVIGNGENVVDLTHVENAVEAHILAWEGLKNNKVDGKAYFISDGRPVMLWKWINELLAKLGVEEIRGKVPLFLAYAVGWVSEGVFSLIKKYDTLPPMTRFVALELAKDHYFNIEAARKDLGYEPKVDLELALQEVTEELDLFRNAFKR